MDANSDGEIELSEYLGYFDIMMYGDKGEKFK